MSKDTLQSVIAIKNFLKFIICRYMSFFKSSPCINLSLTCSKREKLDTLYREPVPKCLNGIPVQQVMRDTTPNSENTSDMNSLIIRIKIVHTSLKFFERFLGYSVNIRRITRLLQTLFKVYGWYTFVYPVYTINNL